MLRQVFQLCTWHSMYGTTNLPWFQRKTTHAPWPLLWPERWPHTTVTLTPRGQAKNSEHTQKWSYVMSFTSTSCILVWGKFHYSGQSTLAIRLYSKQLCMTWRLPASTITCLIQRPWCAALLKSTCNATTVGVHVTVEHWPTTSAYPGYWNTRTRMQGHEDDEVTNDLFLFLILTSNQGSEVPYCQMALIASL